MDITKYEVLLRAVDCGSLTRACVIRFRRIRSARELDASYRAGGVRLEVAEWRR